MAGEKIVLLNGLQEADKIVFTSILSLLSFKTNADWHVASEGKFDIAVVDVDNESGKKVAMDLERQGRPVICFGVNEYALSHTLRLNKPLRANDILNCLNNYEAPVQQSITRASAPAAEADKNLVGVRLTKWPDREVLASFPGSSKLCAALMKHAISLERASDVSGLPYQSVKKFVDMCKAKGCIAEMKLAYNNNEPVERKKSNGLLFSKLRLKFSTRSF